ncbi:MAG: helix-turn-helix domain-containing protein, partial [Faecousia sp.]
MIIQKLTHYTDSILTQEMARMELEGGQVVVAWYTNQQNSQSVVHSHPYYELIAPFVGSSVRYSADGNIYDLRVGELILFPAERFHSGKYNMTNGISERLVIQIDTDIWREAWELSGLKDAPWQKEIVILDADAVATWDLRGLFERMAQTAYMRKSFQSTVQRSQLVELLLLISQIVDERRTAPPSATSALVAKAVGYLQSNYADPKLTVAQLAKYTYTSREHLSRAFKDYTMESVHGYLTNLRMQHCRRAIAAGASVLDACTSSGFSNYTSFLKSFRNLYGITPS